MEANHRYHDQAMLKEARASMIILMMATIILVGQNKSVGLVDAQTTHACSFRETRTIDRPFVPGVLAPYHVRCHDNLLPWYAMVCCTE
jgi:hypothetical protein